jgi:hypothetical protein
VRTGKRKKKKKEIFLGIVDWVRLDEIGHIIHLADGPVLLLAQESQVAKVYHE